MRTLFICLFCALLSTNALSSTFTVMPSNHLDLSSGSQFMKTSQLKERTLQDIAYTLTCHTDPITQTFVQPINSSIFEDLAIISFSKIFTYNFDDMKLLMIQKDFLDFLKALFVTEACHIERCNYFLRYADVLRQQHNMQKRRLTLESIPEIDNETEVNKGISEKSTKPNVLQPLKNFSERIYKLRRWISWLEILTHAPVDMKNFYQTSRGEWLFRTKKILEIPYQMICDQNSSFVYLRDKYTRAFHIYRQILMKALLSAKYFLQNLLKSLHN